MRSSQATLLALRRLLSGVISVLLLASGVLGVSHERQPTSLCDLRVCQCPLGGVSLICSCDTNLQEILVQAKGDPYVPSTVGSITISNCLQVRVTSNSLADIRPLNSVTLSNIKHLNLEPEAFAWVNHYESIPHGINIVITNTNIPNLPQDVFKGHINSVRLNNTVITDIKPLAFANIRVPKMDRIDITNSIIQNVSPKAFSKFVVSHFLIEGGYIGRLPSYAMNSIEVLSQLRFENVNFGTIQSSAFRISETKSFLLRSCRIGILEGEAFLINVKTQIFIDDNIFDNIRQRAFVGIHIDPRNGAYSGSYEYIFENNTLTKFEEYALELNTSGTKLTIDRIILNKECSCTDLKSWSTTLVKISGKTSIPPSKLMWCRFGKTNSVVVYNYEQNNCNKSNRKINWVLAGPIILLIVLLGLCCLSFWCYRRHSKRYISVMTKENHRKSVHSIILDNYVIPSPKTYQVTEVSVMTESVESIQENMRAPQPAPRTNI